MQATITKTLDSAVRVVLVEDDAEWKAEFEQYGYDTDMWVTYIGEFEEEWRDNVAVTHTLADEEYGFMCGNTSDRRCYGFAVDVHKAEEADGTFSFWITEEQYETIG
jgi:hypothetical protein